MYRLWATHCRGGRNVRVGSKFGSPADPDQLSDPGEETTGVSYRHIGDETPTFTGRIWPTTVTKGVPEPSQGEPSVLRFGASQVTNTGCPGLAGLRSASRPGRSRPPSLDGRPLEIPFWLTAGRSTTFGGRGCRMTRHREVPQPFFGNCRFLEKRFPFNQDLVGTPLPRRTPK